MKRATWASIFIAALALSLLLSAANFFLGNLNQDEGWYLYAARLVASGQVLYRDFMFTQGPALPTVYGLLFPVIDTLGVAGGRLITALFGLAAAGCAAWLAARSVSRSRNVAALCAFILVGVNVYQSYFTVIVKTYALCAFFLTAGFVALSYTNSRRGARAAWVGGMLLALAACTRLSAGIALPTAGLWLLWNQKKTLSHNGVPPWIVFGIGGGLVLLFGLGSFFWMAPENTQFALFGYHAGRSPGSLTQLIALKVGFISRFVQAYFVFTVGTLLAVFIRRGHRQRREREDDEMVLDSRPQLLETLRQAHEENSPFRTGFVALLWLCGGLVTLVHFLAPFPYDDYQVFIFPLLAAALSATLVPRCPQKQWVRASLLLLLICTAASFSSPLNQEWLIRGRDRIWWRFKEMPDLALLQKVGAELHEKLGDDGLLLTQDTYLAVESKARVPRGMEMGPFSYYPDLSREQAEKFNLLNREMLIELLQQTPAPLAAFSGYGLTIRSPEVEELSDGEQKTLRAALDAGYTRIEAIPQFGQAHTELEIYKQKPAAETSGTGMEVAP